MCMMCRRLLVIICLGCWRHGNGTFIISRAGAYWRTQGSVASGVLMGVGLSWWRSTKNRKTAPP